MNQNYNINELTEEQIDVLMADVLSGEYTEEELSALSEWLHTDPSHMEEFRKVRSYWKSQVTAQTDIDTGVELNKLLQRVNASSCRPHRFSTRRWWQLTAIAASLLVGLVGGWAISRYQGSEPQLMSYITGDSIATFNLPDGSEISLNKNSRLDFSSDFGKSDRKVHLGGEGYFNVTHQEELPFIVDMDHSSIQVYGTRFNAYHDSETGMSGAALVEGSVAFQANGQKIMLTPCRKVDYDSAKNELSINKFDPQYELAWKENLFRYKSLTLEELVEQLMCRYDIRIVIAAGSDSNEVYSGALDLNLSNPQLLDILGMQTDITWTRHDETYIITRP